MGQRQELNKKEGEEQQQSPRGFHGSLQGSSWQ